MSYDFCRVIEQHTVRTVAQLVAETILRRKVNKLNDQLCLWLGIALHGKKLGLKDGSTRNLNLSQLCDTCWLFFRLLFFLSRLCYLLSDFSLLLCWREQVLILILQRGSIVEVCADAHWQTVLFHQTLALVLRSDCLDQVSRTLFACQTLGKFALR